MTSHEFKPFVKSVQNSQIKSAVRRDLLTAWEEEDYGKQRKMECMNNLFFTTHT